MITAHHLVFGRKYKQPIPSDYSLSYKFNGNLIDDSVNLNNGTNPYSFTGKTIPSYVSGKNGLMCANFTSTNAFNTTNKSWRGPSSSSFSFWIKTSQLNATIFTDASHYLNQNGTLLRIINGKLNISGNCNINSTILINDNLWHHIVIRLDVSKIGSERIRFIIDTIDVTDFVSISNIKNYRVDPLSIGTGNELYGSFIGNMQYFRVYNRILTQEEITNLYNE